MIDTKSHVSNKVIQKQFEELDSFNIRERFFYGIVSDISPDKDNSPLSVSIYKNIYTILINNEKEATEGDYIQLNYYEEDGNLNTKKITSVVEGVSEGNDNWTYYNNSEETAVSISDCLNRNFGKYLISSAEGTRVSITTFEGKTTLTLNTETEILKINSYSNFQIAKGTVVFPDGNKLSLEKDTPVDIESVEAQEGDEFRILLKYKLTPATFGENLFGENEVKTYSFDSLENSVVLEKIDSSELKNNEVCIGIIKVVNGSFKIIDTHGHLYTYNRPWFSAKDVFHINELGSSKVTDNNPHGIGYNDIDPDNTLHNRLLDNGIIISKPGYVQDCAGVLIKEILLASNVIIDENNVFKIESTNYPRYYKLSYYPNQILGIYIKETNKEISFKHIRGTCYLLVEDVLEDIIVIYLTTKTAFSNLEYSQGININSINSNDILLSEGKNVVQFNTFLDLFHKNINGYYIMGIDKNGDTISNPSVKANNRLEVDSNEFKDIDSISRVKIYLYSTDAKFDLDCPNSGIEFSATEEYNLFKTNSSYIINKINGEEKYKLFKESYISPSYNYFNEIDKNNDDKILNTEKLVRDYIKININNEYGLSEDGNNVNVKSINIQDYGNLYENNRELNFNIDGENKKLLKVTGIIKLKNINTGTPSAKLKNNGVSIGDFIGENGSVSCIKIDFDSSHYTGEPIFTNLISLSFDSGFGGYVTEINLNLIYDEIYNRYFITQEENEGKQVTRIIYDPTFSEYGDSVEKIGNAVYIKKEDIIYNEDDLFKGSSSEEYIEVLINSYKGKEVTFNFKTKINYEEDFPEIIKSVTLTDEDIGISLEVTSENTEFNISDDYKGISIMIPSFNDVEDDDTVVVSIIKKIDDNKFPQINNLKTNSDFNVEISLYGESNGESVTETITFDPSFREQEPFNYKLSENAFESLSKYTINSRNTNGNILILTFPISNYTNPCNISSMQFKQDNTITKFIDTRICVSKIDDSLINTEDMLNMMDNSSIIESILGD